MRRSPDTFDRSRSSVARDAARGCSTRALCHPGTFGTVNQACSRETQWPFVILGVRGSCRVAMITGSPGGSPSPNCAR